MIDTAEAFEKSIISQLANHGYEVVRAKPNWYLRKNHVDIKDNEKIRVIGRKILGFSLALKSYE